MTSRSAKRTKLLLQKQSEQESEQLLQMIGDISIWWNSIYDMILRAMRLRIPLQNWLDKQILQEPGLECLDLSNMNWKKLRYLIVLLCPFVEYTSLIGNTRDAMINHTWNVYNVLFDHLDMVQKKLDYKTLAKTPWIVTTLTITIPTTRLASPLRANHMASDS